MSIDHSSYVYTRQLMMDGDFSILGYIRYIRY